MIAAKLKRAATHAQKRTMLQLTSSITIPASRKRAAGPKHAVLAQFVIDSRFVVSYVTVSLVATIRFVAMEEDRAKNARR